MSKDGDVKPGPEAGDRASRLTDTSLYRTTLEDLPDPVSRWRPVGTERRARWSNRALVDEPGVITGYRPIGRDVTARRYRGPALRGSEARLRAVFGTNADGASPRT